MRGARAKLKRGVQRTQGVAKQRWASGKRLRVTILEIILIKNKYTQMLKIVAQINKIETNHSCLLLKYIKKGQEKLKGFFWRNIHKDLILKSFLIFTNLSYCLKIYQVILFYHQNFDLDQLNYLSNLQYFSMGAKGSQVVDPNNLNTGGNAPSNQGGNKQNQQGSNEQFMQIIKQAFRNCSQNGMLSKDKFNQALSILQALGFKRLRDTPLADRLFYIFDKNHSGMIYQNEFIKGIGEIISDRENAISYTFRAYDKDGDNMVSRKEFMQFIEESWKAAFRLLSQDLENKPVGVKIKDIESWTASKVSVLNERSSALFNSVSGGSDKADYQSFRNYILRGQVNDVTAQLDQRTTSVPLNLTILH